MTEQGTLTLRTVEGDGLRFEADFATGRLVMDSGGAAVAPNPVQALLAALAACVGMDVISVLRKKRQQVTGYDIEMSGERAESHPRRFTAIRLVHRVTGRSVERTAVEDSIRLSLEKYCSVYSSIRPDITVTNEIEIVEG